MIALDIEIEAGEWTTASDVRALAQRAADSTLAYLAIETTDQLTAALLLTDDRAMRELNRAWRGQDKATNVLSFPAAPHPVPPGAPHHLGDVALAYETVAREAGAEGKSLADHTSHLVVHGLLHLLGHDHEVEAAAVEMERVEVAVLTSLGIPHPYEAHRDAAPAS